MLTNKINCTLLVKSSNNTYSKKGVVTTHGVACSLYLSILLC